MFKYKVVKTDGSIYNGTLLADSEMQANNVLSAQGYTVLMIKDMSKKKLEFGGFISKGYISILMRQLATMLKAQIPIATVIKIVKDEEKNHKALELLDSIYSDLQSGKSFAQTLGENKKYFSTYVISLVEAGEANGQLENAVEKIADKLERDREIVAKVRSALIYPILLIVIAIAATIALNILVIPAFANMFDTAGAELPGITKFLISTSEFLSHFWWLVAVVVVMIISTFIVLWRHDKTRRILEELIIRIPIYKGIFESSAMSNICSSLSSLLYGGVPIIKSVQLTQSIVNTVRMKEEFSKIEMKVRQGMSMHQAFCEVEGGITPLVLEMIKIGEESGKLDEVLKDTARIYEKELDRKLKTAVSWIEPMITLVMGIIVAIIVIAVVMPMFEMYSLIGV